MPNLEAIRSRLAKVGQSHLLNFFAALTPVQQQDLLVQIESLDIEQLPALVDTYVKSKPVFSLPPELGPAPYFPKNEKSPGRSWDRAAMERTGESLIKAGKVAAFVVAGGQGSRLGFEGPKGCYSAGAVTGKSLFQIFAEHFVAAKVRYGATVPWYIMTSPLNHAATVAFFEEHKFFGLSQRDVQFFPQGVMPSLEIATGRVLLAGKGEVATNPDGHGGCVKALSVSGALADMRRRGVEHISYFQVDNPLVRPLDPAFIGLHAAGPGSSAEMSSKMIPKAYPEEKVGVFCSSQGKVEVIEYSDLPMDLQKQRLEDGSLRFIAGSIAIHIMGVEFVERLANDPKFALPYHRAEKKVPCIDPISGAAINPSGNNGVKLEKFVFDALSLCRGSIVFETDRTEEFAPIKNAAGLDSIDTSRSLQTERAARWLEAAGVAVPRKTDGSPDCVLEVSPVTATCAAEMAAAKPTLKIDRGAKVAL
ncbi:MAG: UDPGP type 1 family protein [Planctomycetes bacterium]|nr:UDPGP type 1 family protein [Planctomycetota bacterium]